LVRKKWIKSFVIVGVEERSFLKEKKRKGKKKDWVLGGRYLEKIGLKPNTRMGRKRGQLR
jgi:hypothetical protein